MDKRTHISTNDGLARTLVNFAKATLSLFCWKQVTSAYKKRSCNLYITLRRNEYAIHICCVNQYDWEAGHRNGSLYVLKLLTEALLHHAAQKNTGGCVRVSAADRQLEILGKHLQTEIIGWSDVHILRQFG